METRNYWCYRICTSSIKFFADELINHNRLRQGWGYDDGQNLRVLTVDEGARRNLPMFNNVKKGDILLIPQLPEWGKVAIVEATEDWNTGYTFNIVAEQGDFGHIFPAKYLASFVRYNGHVTGGLRSTLKNLSRFWNINKYAADIEKLMTIDKDNLSDEQSYRSRLENTIQNSFDEKLFTESLYANLTKQFTREEWEYALLYGLEKLYPFYNISREGGVEEAKHGTDILIRIPGIRSGTEFGIAIQVKDYEGLVANDVISQIKKADYWNSETLKIIEKIVIVTKAKKEENSALAEKDPDVKFIFVNELKDLLAEIGKCFIGINKK